MTVKAEPQFFRLIFAMALVAGMCTARADYSELSGEYYLDSYPSAAHDIYLKGYAGSRVESAYGDDVHFAGYADARAGSVGAYAFTEAPRAQSDQAGSSMAAIMRLQRRVTASPGSGLSVGAPVTLQLNVQVEGAFDWGFMPIDEDPVGELVGYVGANAIVDVRPKIGASSWGGEYASFNLSVSKEFHGWLDENNRPFIFADRVSDKWFYLGNGSTIEKTGVIGADLLELRDTSMGTDWVSFEFEAYVGDVLDIFAGLDVLNSIKAEQDGNGWMWVENDFLNTFQFSVTPVTPGVTLSQVPVPPALWLFGTGLLGLAGVARRRR